MQPVLSYFSKKKTILYKLRVADIRQLAKKHKQLEIIFNNLQFKLQHGLCNKLDLFPYFSRHKTGTKVLDSSINSCNEKDICEALRPREAMKQMILRLAKKLKCGCASVPIFKVMDKTVKRRKSKIIKQQIFQKYDKHKISVEFSKEDFNERDLKMVALFNLQIKTNRILKFEVQFFKANQQLLH